MTTFKTESTSSVDPLKEKKLRLLAEARTFHKDLLDKLGVPQNDFQLKMPFQFNERMVVGIFPSEFNKTKGLYFELITRDIELSSSERKVYRIPPSAFYAEEYQMSPKGSYLVPVDELQEISKYSVPQTSSPKKQSSSQEAEDAPFDQMTIRDYITIHTGKPVSNKEWLNNLVTDITRVKK